MIKYVYHDFHLDVTTARNTHAHSEPRIARSLAPETEDSC